MGEESLMCILSMYEYSYIRIGISNRDNNYSVRRKIQQIGEYEGLYQSVVE